MYSPNNIRFRIVSSSAIAQFRQDQAFDFNELINNLEYSFSPEAREILLLNYDMWFRFILRLEKVLIRNHHSSDALGSFVNHLEMFARETVNEIHDTMASHPEMFGLRRPVSAAIDKAYKMFTDHVMRVIVGTSKETMYSAFPIVVTALSNCLNNLLFVLHETENLAKGQPFLSYTEEVREILDATDVCSLTQRAKLYGAESFVIKNYTNREVDPRCIKSLQANGIVITDVKDASL